MNNNNILINKLHKQNKLLNKQLEERDKIILILRKELENLGYKKASQQWVELND
jgi:hypothetical protein